MIIREMVPSDFIFFKEIMRQLPEYFDEHALGAILVDLKYQHGFAACNPPAGTIAGLVSCFVYEAVLNIGWIAVAREYRRCGIGTLLDFISIRHLLFTLIALKRQNQNHSEKR